MSCGYWDLDDPEELTEEFDAQEVVPNLYIGSKSAALAVNQLRDHHITHILSVSTIPLSITNEFKCLTIEVEDEDKNNLSNYFPQCHQFIKTGRDLGGILIHCTAGVSRSATIVISYLMSIFFKPFWDCFQYLRNIRPCIQPNKGFVSQLINYETMILTKTVNQNTKKEIINSLNDSLIHQQKQIKSLENNNNLNDIHQHDKTNEISINSNQCDDSDGSC